MVLIKLPVMRCFSENVHREVEEFRQLPGKIMVRCRPARSCDGHPFWFPKQVMGDFSKSYIFMYLQLIGYSFWIVFVKVGKNRSFLEYFGRSDLCKKLMEYLHPFCKIFVKFGFWSPEGYFGRSFS